MTREFIRNLRGSLKGTPSVLDKLLEERRRDRNTTLGRYRKEFLRALDASAEDHRRGRTRVRKSLRELVR